MEGVFYSPIWEILQQLVPKKELCFFKSTFAALQDWTLLWYYAAFQSFSLNSAKGRIHAMFCTANLCSMGVFDATEEGKEETSKMHTSPAASKQFNTKCTVKGKFKDTE